MRHHNTVIHGLLKLMPWGSFDRSVDRHQADKKVRRLTTRNQFVALFLAVAALLILPWVIGNEFYVNMATQVLIYALFALSINVMLGYGGMVSLGHSAYLGISGYACILLVQDLAQLLVREISPQPV